VSFEREFSSLQWNVSFTLQPSSAVFILCKRRKKEKEKKGKKGKEKRRKGKKGKKEKKEKKGKKGKKRKKEKTLLQSNPAHMTRANDGHTSTIRRGLVGLSSAAPQQRCILYLASS
jgi:hypothetical protein